jgi:hypothetical protein
VVEKSAGSNFVILPAPLLPQIIFDQVESKSFPNGETMPRPVMTTRLCSDIFKKNYSAEFI